MKTGILISFLFLFKLTYSQTLIPDATKVKSAFDNLSKDTGSKNFQKLYVAAFPFNTMTFLNVFHTEKFDQLYSGSYKYIEAFQRCATEFPKEVIDKCVDIGKNFVWDADAVGQLQRISVNLATKYTEIFVGKYETLDSSEQYKLIAFYADVENHNAYSDYQELIIKLNSIGEKVIAEKFEIARTDRKNKNGH